MDWKRFAEDYLSFTRKERLGLLFVVAILFIFILLPPLLPKDQGSLRSRADTSWITAVRRLETRDSNLINPSQPRRNFAHDYEGSSRQMAGVDRLFFFDPNTLDPGGWKKLGLRDKTILTIKNFLGKGGHFYKPEDLSKIYGLSSDDYTRLSPYVRIESTVMQPAGHERNREKAKTRIASYPVVEINTADTSAFIALPGIGSKLAARIINFREKLGGFYSIDQVGETYGLADSVFQKIRPYLVLENTAVKKININTASVDELKVHPYMRYNIANAIVSYRNEHGPFSTLEETRKLALMTGDLLNKLAPYLVIQEK